jgi:flagellar protein FliO/FliZ
MQYLSWILAVGVAAAIAAAGFLVWRSRQEAGGTLGGGLFGPRPEKRLGYVEQMAIDGRRRLVLVRRDDVEHLILTGGPVDVVVETGIGAERARAPSASEEEAGGSNVVYARSAR